VLKFPRVPGNILARGLEYSPAGIMRAFWHVIKPIQEARADGISWKEAFSEKHQSKFINSIAEGTIGTIALVGLGLWLRSLGIITGRSDDDYDVSNFNRAIGFGEYRLNVSALWRYVTSAFNPDAAKPQKGDDILSYDWLQPSAIGISMGANLYDDTHDERIKKKDSVGKAVDMFSTLMVSVSSGAETVAEMPVVRGVREFFGGRNAVDGIVKAAESVPASFVPTFVNNLRQINDSVSRNTYDPNLSDYVYNLIINRIPGMSQKLPENYDIFGNVKNVYDDKGKPVLHAFNVFLNPAFATKYKLTPEAALVVNTMLSSGDTTIVPRYPKKSFSITVKGKAYKFKLSGEELSEFQRIAGTITREGFKNINPDQKNEDKIEKMYKILNLSGKTARTRIIQNRLKGLKTDDK
jgi:hypothetical protein